MKKTLFIVILFVFISMIVTSLLLPGKVYEQLSDSLFGNKSQDIAQAPRDSTPKQPTIIIPKPPQADVEKETSKQTTPKPDPSIEVVQGFDWRLPSYPKRSDLSGLVSETRGADEYIRADFHMVRWDTTNPQQTM